MGTDTPQKRWRHPLGKMPTHKQGEALTLRKQGMTVSQIATKMGVSIARAYALYRLAAAKRGVILSKQRIVIDKWMGETLLPELVKHAGEKITVETLTTHLATQFPTLSQDTLKSHYAYPLLQQLVKTGIVRKLPRGQYLLQWPPKPTK